MIILQRIALMSVLISLLSGCSTPGVGVLPDNEEMTTTQIYNQVIKSNGANTYNRNSATNTIRLREDVAYSNGTRNKINSINKQFSTLPNPQIPLYIFAHRAEAGGEFIPVSGYTTAFHLYRQNQFALPAEAY